MLQRDDLESVFHVGAAVDPSALAASARELSDNPTPDNVSRTVNELRNAVEAGGGSWEEVAKRAVTEGIRSALNVVGLGFLADYVGPIWNAIRGALSVTVYPVDEFVRWAQLRTGLPGEKLAYEATGPKGGPWDLWFQSAIAAGWFPLYLGDKDAAAIAAALEAFGWPVRARWSKRFGEWYTEHKTRTGLLLNVSDMTPGGPSVRLAAAKWGKPEDRAAVAPLRTKARDLLELVRSPGAGPVPFLLDSGIWSASGIFPPLPGSSPPRWLVDKAGISPEPFALERPSSSRDVSDRVRRDRPAPDTLTASEKLDAIRRLLAGR